MTDLTKIFAHIRGASTLKPNERHELANAIQAAAPHMEVADLKPLNKALTELIAADAAKHSAKSMRLAKIQAAMENPAMEPSIKYCSGRLRSLGLDINAIAASADVRSVDKAMAEMRWTPEERVRLKTALSHIGCLD